jgi:hypothetical protein
MAETPITIPARRGTAIAAAGRTVAVLPALAARLAARRVEHGRASAAHFIVT